MRKNLFVLLTVVALLALVATPVFAITYGTSDQNQHPYVGLVGFYDANGNWMWRCSGALLSPTVFLTAGHCTGIDPELGYGPTFAQVWFEQGPIQLVDTATQCLDTNGVPLPGMTGYACAGGVIGTPIPHPEWNGYLTIPNTHDIGVVILNEPVILDTYAALPEPGFLDELAIQRGQDYPTFTAVGYGLESVKPTTVSRRERMVGTMQLINLRSNLTDGYNIQLSANPGKGLDTVGGTCFGDSGGPIFYDSTNIIIAVTSFGMNANCKGTSFEFRVDTTQSLEFLAQFLP